MNVHVENCLAGMTPFEFSHRFYIAKNQAWESPLSSGRWSHMTSGLTSALQIDVHALYCTLLWWKPHDRKPMLLKLYHDVDVTLVTVRRMDGRQSGRHDHSYTTISRTDAP